MTTDTVTGCGNCGWCGWSKGSTWQRCPSCGVILQSPPEPPRVSLADVIREIEDAGNMGVRFMIGGHHSADNGGPYLSKQDLIKRLREAFAAPTRETE